MAPTTPTTAIPPAVEAAAPATSAPPNQPHSPESTFRSYNPSQARAYASGRGTYPWPLYDAVLTHHAQTHGGFAQLLDVGCGPGNSTQDLAAHFEAATGVDGSAEMVVAARARGDVAGGGGAVEYRVVTAEELGQAAGLREGSVDLLTAGMAAHWFDMPVFWAQAARLVRPGGTVALWTVSSQFCDPRTRNAARVQEVLFELELGMLAPFELPGNRLSREMYVDLGLPWTVEPPVEGFKKGFVRKEWNRDGKVGEDGVFLMGRDEAITLTKLAESLGTASMVTRWRQAHPELVGTPEDCVEVTMRKLREALGGEEEIIIGGSTTLLLFKRI